MKTALITGCSSGIGRATAERFHDEGWRVYATARDTDDITGLSEQGMETLELDVTEDGDCGAAVEAVEDDHDTVDCLVNNAGYGQMGAVEDVPVEDMHRQMEVNLYGPQRLTRRVLPGMRDQESGTIVNVSSIAGQISPPGMGVYSASKHALEAVSDSLRVEVADFDVDVVLVEPGPVETEFGGRADEEYPDAEDSAYSKLYTSQEERDDSLSRFTVTPEDVAETIHEAAEADSPKARYTVTWSFRAARIVRNVPPVIRDRLLR